MSESLSRTLARFASSLKFDALPAAVVDKIKASLLHALVIGIVGAGTEHGRAAIALAKQEEAKDDGATILSDGARATRAGAAYANSALMHATNQSDSYRMLIHPGPCVIPAALASAELGGKSGKDLLTALAAGYEVETRVAGDFIPTTQARGFRSSPVYGTLGAAVAAGKLIGLDEDQTVTALALACTFAGGTNEGPRTGGREMLFHEPNAARNGIMAALLAGSFDKLRTNGEGAGQGSDPGRGPEARLGPEVGQGPATGRGPAAGRGAQAGLGSETALEGEAGFYHAFTGNNRGELTYTFTGPLQASLADVVADLGSQWELMHVTPKIYPTAGYNCPVIELMARLCANHEISPGRVESITVDMNWLENLYPSPAFPRPQPASPGVGSTHYFAAYTCVHGSYPPLAPRLYPDSDAGAEDQRVMELMQRVKVLGHKDRPSFSPRITVVMQDGRRWADEFNGDELKWDLATETRRISALFDDIPWPRQRLDAIVQAVSGLEGHASVDSLIRQCVPG